jgi:hypothetical protein
MSLAINTNIVRYYFAKLARDFEKSSIFALNLGIIR